MANCPQYSNLRLRARRTLVVAEFDKRIRAIKSAARMRSFSDHIFGRRIVSTLRGQLLRELTLDVLPVGRNNKAESSNKKQGQYNAVISIDFESDVQRLHFWSN